MLLLGIGSRIAAIGLLVMTGHIIQFPLSILMPIPPMASGCRLRSSSGDLVWYRLITGRYNRFKPEFINKTYLPIVLWKPLCPKESILVNLRQSCTKLPVSLSTSLRPRQSHPLVLQKAFPTCWYCASQINQQCAYCVRECMLRDALVSGETIDRISVIPGMRETSYFNEKECAALATWKQQRWLLMDKYRMQFTTMLPPSFPKRNCQRLSGFAIVTERLEPHWYCAAILSNHRNANSS